MPLGRMEMGNYSIELKQGDFPFHYLKSGQISASDINLGRYRTFLL
jgi:hypothetical protein